MIPDEPVQHTPFNRAAPPIGLLYRSRIAPSDSSASSFQKTSFSPTTGIRANLRPCLEHRPDWPRIACSRDINLLCDKWLPLMSLITQRAIWGRRPRAASKDIRVHVQLTTTCVFDQSRSASSRHVWRVPLRKRGWHLLNKANSLYLRDLSDRKLVYSMAPLLSVTSTGNRLRVAYRVLFFSPSRELDTARII